jgi:alpha-tubulin suppressor-like RCC1 family protein
LRPVCAVAAVALFLFVSTSSALAQQAQVAQVAAGYDHTCALKTDGTVWCWGSNGDGQIGDGTFIQRLSPVASLFTGETSISSGNQFTTALKGNGTLQMWGGLPRVNADVFGSSVVAASSGQNYTCALNLNGTLLCDGQCGSQLGIGTSCPDPLSPAPAVASLGSEVLQVSAGSNYACAVKTDGTLWCWGDNTFSQLGDGTQVQRSTPVQVTSFGSGEVASVSAGQLVHTCAVKVDGTAWCWGTNIAGNIGAGQLNDVDVGPVQVTDLGKTVASISAGLNHTCALKVDGTVWCWGESGTTGDGMSSGG